MRTLRRLSMLALLSVWLAIPITVDAQTTTTTETTSTTTTSTTATTTTATTTTATTTTATTTTIPDTVGPCAAIDHIQASAYWMAGIARGAQSYTTGGMFFGHPNGIKPEAACLCHSRFRKVMGVLFGPVDGYTFDWDNTNHLIRGFTAPATEIGAGTDLHTLDIPFVAVCQ